MSKQQDNDPYMIPLNEQDEQIQQVPESVSDSEDAQPSQQFRLASKKIKAIRGFARLFFLCLFLFAAWEVWQLHRFLLQFHWGLSAALWSLLGLLALYTLQVFLGLRANMRDVGQIKDLQSQASQLLEQRQVGGAKHYLKALEHLYQDKPQLALLMQAKGQLQDYHDDKEALQLIDATMMQALDEQALRVISRYSKRVGAMVALSPLVIADLLLALLNSFKMIDELAQIYGVRPSWFGRIQLSRMVVKQLALVGAAEIGSDLVADLGGGVLGGASSRVAQGVGVGLYSARIGIQTMRVCRPLPFKQSEQPKLRQVLSSIRSSISLSVERKADSADQA